MNISAGLRCFIFLLVVGVFFGCSKDSQIAFEQKNPVTGVILDKPFSARSGIATDSELFFEKSSQINLIETINDDLCHHNYLNERTLRIAFTDFLKVGKFDLKKDDYFDSVDLIAPEFGEGLLPEGFQAQSATVEIKKIEEGMFSGIVWGTLTANFNGQIVKGDFTVKKCPND